MADILQVLQERDDLSTLVNALQTAGLVDSLKGSGPFTLLAPSNDAFALLPRHTLDQLFHDTPRLRQALLYHVVEGQFTSEDIDERDILRTIEGEDIAIHAPQGRTLDNAGIIEADILCNNGIIHIIDRVLLPGVETSLRYR